MLLKRGSGNTFSGLWNGDPFNAPALNLSYWSPTDLYSTGEFRMSMDSSWGPFEELTVTGFNELDDPLAEIAFDVTGYDITYTSWLSAPVLYTDPVAEGLGAVNVFLSDSTSECVVHSNATSEVWFAIMNNIDPRPRIVIANNSSNTFTKGELDVLPANPSSEFLYMETHFDDGNVYLMNMTAAGWNDGVVYVDGLSVEAYNLTSQPMLFTVSYKLPGFLNFTDLGDNGNQYFYTDGVLIDLPTLPVSEIMFKYEYDVKNSTIQLYGPATSYVSAPFLLVTGYFKSQVSSTSPLTSTTTETTTSSLETSTTTSVESTTDATTPTLKTSTTASVVSTTDATTPTLKTSTTASVESTTDATTPTLKTSTTASVESTTDATTSTLETSTTTSVESTTDATTPTLETSTTASVESTTDATTPTLETSTTASVESTTGATSPTLKTSTPTTSTESTAYAINFTSSASTTSMESTTGATISALETSPTATSMEPTTGATMSTLETSPTATSMESTTVQEIPTFPNTSTYTIYPNMSVSVNGTLYCPCYVSNASVASNNPANESQSFNAMLAEMTLRPTDLSKTSRKYKSAPDARHSSVAFGTLAIVLIVTVFSFVVYLDSTRLVTEFAKIKHNYRQMKRQWSRRSLVSFEQSPDHITLSEIQK